MSLYQQYRPLSFADVVGQEAIVTTLSNAIKQDKLAHAYLFAGSRGTGKTSVARILAKAIMTKGLKEDALTKQIVKGIEEGSLVDLIEIDAASNRGIDEIRDLIEKIQFSPVVAAAKVYIIDEVHMLTKEAFNALLKTLEEPPTYAFFVLATTELNKIPATIQSRCQCFPFRRIAEGDIIDRLQFIADQEKISLEPGALQAVAHHANGGLRDAISLLDQMRSLKTISAEDVFKRIGATGLEHCEAVMSALSQKDAETILKAIAEVEASGTALETFTRQLLNLTRQQLHEAAKNGDNVDSWQNILSTLLEAIRDLRISPVPGLVLEAALLELIKDPTVTPEPIAVPEPPKPTVKPAAKPKAAKKETPKKAKKEEKTEDAIITAPAANIMTVQQKWDEIVDLVSPASVKMSLKNGNPKDVEGDTITVAFSSQFHCDTVTTSAATRAIEDALETVFKQHLKINCIVEAGTGESKTEDLSDDEVNLAEAASEVF